MKQKKQTIFNLIFYLTLTITIIITIFTKKITNLDELWNFSYAKNIADGLTPYKDFNMIVTPLYASLNSIILTIFGKYLYIYRITNILLFTLLAFIFQKIQAKLNINNYITKLFLIIYFYLLLKITYNDYNFFNLILLSLIIYLELKNKDNPINNLIIGLLCSFIILTKQTTGLIISIAALSIPLLEHFLFKRKSIPNFKTRLISLSSILIIFLIYLLLTNNFSNFIDLTILGLSGFNSRTYTPLYFLLAITLLSLVIIIIQTIHAPKDKQQTNLTLIIYSLFSLSLNYPILDPIHFLISIAPTLILLLYNFSFNIHPKILLTILIYLIITLNISNYNNLKNYQNNNYLPSTYTTYKNLKVEKYIKDNLLECINYINNQEEKVYILSHNATYYMLALNEYHHYFDLPLSGNIGTKGETEMLNVLKNENITLLINNRQMIENDFPKIDKYLKKHYKIISNVAGFNIYKKNNLS